MARYAEGTTTSPENSRRELERLLNNYGAQRVIVGHGSGHGAVQFTVHGREAKFQFTMPPLEHFRRVKVKGQYYPRIRTDAEAKRAWEKEHMRQWRVLILRVKARLEYVRSEVEDFDPTQPSDVFDEEFLAHLMLPSGETVAQQIAGRLDRADILRLPPPRENAHD